MTGFMRDKKVKSKLTHDVGDVRMYDGQWVIIVSKDAHENHVWVRYEDDRRNIEYEVRTSALK